MAMDLYFLKHKDMRVAILSFDDDYQIKHIGIEIPGHLPNLGNNDPKMIHDWLANRAAPDARDDMENAKRGSGCHSTRELLIKNYALSLSDCYWICPADEERSWDEVKLYDKDTSVHFYEQSDRIFSGNISLGGNMPKQWKLDEENKWCIYKTCENGCINQTINEVFASELSAKQKQPWMQVSHILHIVFQIPTRQILVSALLSQTRLRSLFHHLSVYVQEKSPEANRFMTFT